MKNKENKKKHIGLLFIGILLFAAIALLISYAYWQISKNQEEENLLGTGCFDMTFEELSEGITLENTYPISDEEGLLGTPYSFTIKNTCEMYVNYQINLEVLPVETTRLDSVYVKVALNNDIYNLTNELEVTSTIDNAIEAFKLTTGGLAKDESITFDLLLWMDKDTALEEGQNRAFKSKITVIAVPGIKTSTLKVDKDQNMIAIMWNGTSWVKADETNSNTTYKWYDYETQQWANSVLVKETGTKSRAEYKSASPGTAIDEDDILAYYVYIPRYKYLLWNAENGDSDPQEIKIEFQNINNPKENGSVNGEWLTHPAFTFGTDELNGIWVGKFETSADPTTTCYTTPSVVNCDKAVETINPRIVPNVDAWGYINPGRMFDVAQYFKSNSMYGISSSNLDSHMMKNMEWGAVAYLSHSKYGKWGNETFTGADKEIYINNVYSNDPLRKTVTGCSGGSPNATVVETCPATNTYEKPFVGTGASTTGTIYGVYDMSGGVWEYTMGNMRNDQGNFYAVSAVFSTTPETKYYDSYAYDTFWTTHGRGLLGDATRETLVAFGGTSAGWYSNQSSFLRSSSAWFLRGGTATLGAGAGVFGFNGNSGVMYNTYGFRSVVVSTP